MPVLHGADGLALFDNDALAVGTAETDGNPRDAGPDRHRVGVLEVRMTAFDLAPYPVNGLYRSFLQPVAFLGCPIGGGAMAQEEYQ